jgi:hypothetical protein
LAIRIDQFLQRADAAREGDEGVGALEHQLFARMQVARDDALLGAHQHMLAIGQEFGNDSGDEPAVVEDRFGAGAHQAGRAAAVDQRDAVLGQDSAEPTRCLHEGRVGAWTGAAIDANGFDSVHFDSARLPACGAGLWDNQDARRSFVCTAIEGRWEGNRCGSPEAAA